MEFLFPEYRLDWFGAGPSSPNKTGALLAIIFVAAWWPALRFRRGFWLSLPVAFVAAVFMLQTESRGALVGAVAGSVVLFSVRRLSVGSCRGTLAKASRYVFSLRALVLMAALSVLVFYSQRVGVNERMAAMTSGEDGSSNVRVSLYSAGLQMIAAAPLGWGHGEAGNAYGQWYQAIGDSRSYLSLVNSHLTWMADYGMLFQFAYLAGWVSVFLLCWPVDATVVASLQGGRPVDATIVASLQGDRPVDATVVASLQGGRPVDATVVASLQGDRPSGEVTFAVWVTLGLCGFFSSVLTLGWIWVIPVGLLLLCVIQRLRAKLWPSRRQRIIASAAVLAGFVGLQAAGHALTGGVRIKASPDQVEIGENPKAVALLRPDRQVLGDKYGHTLREYLDEVGGFTVLRDTANGADLAGFERVVLSGSAELTGLRASQGDVVWMNPPADVGEAALEVLEGRSLTVIVGSLGDWRRLRVWQTLVDANPDWNWIQLRGVADFIPNWPKYLNHNPGSENRGYDFGTVHPVVYRLRFQP